MKFRKWLKDYDIETKPIIDKANKRREGHISLEFEEELLSHYLTYRIVKVTWILVIATILVGIIGIILNLWF